MHDSVPDAKGEAMISFGCSSCHQTIRVPDEYAGKRARCKSCGAVLSVPTSRSSLGDLTTEQVIGGGTDDDAPSLDDLARLEAVAQPTNDASPNVMNCSVCEGEIAPLEAFEHEGKPVCRDCIFKLARQEATMQPAQREENESEYALAADLKSCPYCGESIQRSAKKCKHCGEWLEAKRPPIPVVATPVRASPRIPQCSRCGCTQMQVIKRGYDANAGCCFGALLGPLGLLLGFAGSSQTFSVCAACGYEQLLPTVNNFFSALFGLIVSGVLLALVLWLLIAMFS